MCLRKPNLPDPEPKVAAASPPAPELAPAATADSSNCNGRKVILMFACFIVAVILLQAVTIGLVVGRFNDKDERSGDTDRAVDGGDATAPSPTGTPTLCRTLGTAFE